MWHLIGIDKDGKRHHCNQYSMQEDADKALADADRIQNRMVEAYLASIFKAELEYKQLQNMPKSIRPLLNEYNLFKSMGFLIDKFVLEYREDDS